MGLVVLIAYTTFAALQWCANKKAADAAKSAADTAARQLELAERPWVDADIRINGPFAFNVNGASLNVLITTRNTGNSPAFNTTSNERLMFISGGADPFQLRSEVCKGAVSQATTMGFGVSLFPNTDSQTPTTVGLPKEEIEKAGKGQIVGMKLIVCLAYRPTFNNTSVYTTSYIFDISRIEKGLPRADFPVGQEISADQLRLQLGPGSIIAN